MARIEATLSSVVDSPAKDRRRTARRTIDGLVKRPHSQRKAVLNALPSYAENLNEDDEDTENEEGGEEEEQEPVEAKTSYSTVICQRCYQPLKTPSYKLPDLFDPNCDEKLSLVEIGKSLSALPDCEFIFIASFIK